MSYNKLYNSINVTVTDNVTEKNIINLLYDRQKKNYIQKKLDIHIQSQNKTDICY